MGKTDPLAAALAVARVATGGQRMRVDVLFEDRPEVLDGIRAAKARGVSADEIARILSGGGDRISGTAVDNWLKANA